VSLHAFEEVPVAACLQVLAARTIDGAHGPILHC
jgi:hypothetical protein